jgi:hypothetical protein
MRYGHVTNGVIDSGPRSLPSSWANISGLNKMTDEALRPFGWLPWVLVTIPVGQNQVLNGSTITIKPEKILETQIVRDLTSGEIESRNQQARDDNKRQAQVLLSETDWTAASDVGNPSISNPYLVNAAEFAAYRSDLRKIAVNSPVTVDVWPDKPDGVWAYNLPSK